MIHPIIYHSGLGTIYSLSLNWFSGRLAEEHPAIQALKNVVTGVALAAIYHQLGRAATVGAAIGVMAVFGTPHRGREEPDVLVKVFLVAIPTLIGLGISRLV